MDILDRADVQTAGWLDCDQQLRLLIDLAGDDGLLLVAAGHTAGDGGRALAAAHVILLDKALGVFLHGGLFDEAVVLELGLPIALQNHIVRQRVIQHQAVLVAVLRDMAHTRLAALADGGVGDVLAFQLDGTGGGLFQAGNAVDQFALAVAVDTGDADDLARADIEADAAHGVVLVYLAGYNKVFHFQNRLARLAGLFLNGKLHVAADHHLGQFLFGGILDIHRTDVLALAQDRAAVGNGHDLVELMGDEQDALALGLEAAHDIHELVNLLRGQNCRRFVENQDLIVAVQHLQDLDTLLHTDGNVADQRVRVDLQAVLFAQSHDLFAGLVLLQKAVLRILDAEDDVIEHREALDQFEVLMHHAYAQRVGVVRVVDLDFFSVFLDRTLLRLVQTKEHAHQGRFTGTVLAQQGMDLALAQLQGDIVVGFDTGKFLGDVQHFDDIIICQSLHAPFNVYGLVHKFLLYIIQKNSAVHKRICAKSRQNL